VFVERADRQLTTLFDSIDRDGNGKLDIKELQTAFRNAGLTVSNRRLLEFFNDMDNNNDGYVTIDEWRYVSSFLWPLLNEYPGGLKLVVPLPVPAAPSQLGAMVMCRADSGRCTTTSAQAVLKHGRTIWRSSSPMTGHAADCESFLQRFPPFHAGS
jgi:hypothetical protein